MREKKAPAAQPADAPSESPWRQLTWDDLKSWAGQRTVSRGRAYRTAVRELAVAADGRLIAWVQGTRRYATVVGMSRRKSGGFPLSSHCSCPVGISCKHAVAVVVAYLHAIKHGQEIPSATEDDRRWQIVENPGSEGKPDAAGYDDDDDDWNDDKAGDALYAHARVTHPPGRGRYSARATGARGGDANRESIRVFLERKSPVELVDLLLSVLQRNPEERERLQEAADLSRGATSRLVRQARRELESVTAEPAWTNHWGDEGNLPDYSGLRRRFENLLAAGAADALVELGKKLLHRGTRQIGESHDEGITAGGIGGCMAIVFRAVMASSLTDAGKVLYAVEAQLEDEYDLCEGAGLVLDKRWPLTAWSRAADDLRKRLEGMPRPGRTEWSDRDYRRGRLVEQIVELLDRAGRSGEVVPLYESELAAGSSHERLAKRLIAEKRLDDAARWAEEGIALSPPDHEGTRARLQELLRQIAETRGDKPRVAAWRAADFFQGPSLHTYVELTKAARIAGCGPAVKEAALRFLESGVTPPGAVTAGSDAAWPLPPVTSLPGTNSPTTRKAARLDKPQPHFDVLLEIALKERRPDEILRWYDRLRASRSERWGRWFGVDDDLRVADAVAATHPDRSLAIWRAAAEARIAQTSPSAYEEAARLLRKCRALLERFDRGAEWAPYVAALRTANRRKRKLLEILDGLEGRRRAILAS